MSLSDGTKIFGKLVASKMAKGYQYTAASARQTKPYRQSGGKDRDTGIRCHLFNTVEEHEIASLIRSPKYCLQEKHDGRRLLVRKRGDEIPAGNVTIAQKNASPQMGTVAEWCIPTR